MRVNLRIAGRKLLCINVTNSTTNHSFDGRFIYFILPIFHLWFLRKKEERKKNTGRFLDMAGLLSSPNEKKSYLAMFRGSGGEFFRFFFFVYRTNSMKHRRFKKNRGERRIDGWMDGWVDGWMDGFRRTRNQEWWTKGNWIMDDMGSYYLRSVCACFLHIYLSRYSKHELTSRYAMMMEGITNWNRIRIPYFEVLQMVCFMSLWMWI